MPTALTSFAMAEAEGELVEAMADGDGEPSEAMPFRPGEKVRQTGAAKDTSVGTVLSLAQDPSNGGDWLVSVPCGAGHVEVLSCRMLSGVGAAAPCHTPLAPLGGAPAAHGAARVGTPDVPTAGVQPAPSLQPGVTYAHLENWGMNPPAQVVLDDVRDRAVVQRAPSMQTGVTHAHLANWGMLPPAQVELDDVRSQGHDARDAVEPTAPTNDQQSLWTAGMAWAAWFDVPHRVRGSLRPPVRDTLGPDGERRIANAGELAWHTE